jgi:hypothetical protein
VSPGLTNFEFWCIMGIGAFGCMCGLGIFIGLLIGAVAGGPTPPRWPECEHVDRVDWVNDATVARYRELGRMTLEDELDLIVAGSKR